MSFFSSSFRSRTTQYLAEDGDICALVGQPDLVAVGPPRWFAAASASSGVAHDVSLASRRGLGRGARPLQLSELRSCGQSANRLEQCGRGLGIRQCGQDWPEKCMSVDPQNRAAPGFTERVLSCSMLVPYKFV